MVIPCCPEPLEEAAYIYDGTLEGLLSAVFLAYERKEVPGDIQEERLWEPRLGQPSVTVVTDGARALRVRRRVEAIGGKEAFRWILAASLCDDYGKAMDIYRFIAFLVDAGTCGSRVRLGRALADPAVAAVHGLHRKAVNEAEHMRQFLRFSHLENGLWFARCNPSVSAIPLVMGHFTARLNDQPFLIYDEVHCLSGAYDGDSWMLVAGKPDSLPEATAHDGLMEEAWRCFYDALCVDARYNPELRRNFMPQRFWRNLPEMKPSQGWRRSRNRLE